MEYGRGQLKVSKYPKPKQKSPQLEISIVPTAPVVVQETNLMAVEHPKVSPLERGHNQTTMISSGHRSYQNAVVLPEHRSIQRTQEPGDRMYICQLCKEKFVGKKQLIQHCHWHISQDARTSKKTILSESTKKY